RTGPGHALFLDVREIGWRRTKARREDDALRREHRHRSGDREVRVTGPDPLVVERPQEPLVPGLDRGALAEPGPGAGDVGGGEGGAAEGGGHRPAAPGRGRDHAQVDGEGREDGQEIARALVDAARRRGPEERECGGGQERRKKGRVRLETPQPVRDRAPLDREIAEERGGNDEAGDEPRSRKASPRMTGREAGEDRD